MASINPKLRNMFVSAVRGQFRAQKRQMSDKSNIDPIYMKVKDKQAAYAKAAKGKLVHELHGSNKILLPITHLLMVVGGILTVDFYYHKINKMPYTDPLVRLMGDA